MELFKYDAVGNRYYVLDARNHPEAPNAETVQAICESTHPSDGILYGPIHGEDSELGLRIFNPDGSEAEKSGNGLRIFAQFLKDQNLIEQSALLETPAGTCEVRLFSEDKISVQIGKPIFTETTETEQPSFELDGETYAFHGVSVGNPHAVFFVDNPSAELAQMLGPIVENDPFFPHRTNVQLAKVLSPHEIQLEIWERGAGYTLSSGTSASAVAAVAQKIGLCQSPVQIIMPGGTLHVETDAEGSLWLTGPVQFLDRIFFDPALKTFLSDPKPALV